MSSEFIIYTLVYTGFALFPYIAIRQAYRRKKKYLDRPVEELTRIRQLLESQQPYATPSRNDDFHYTNVNFSSHDQIHDSVAEMTTNPTNSWSQSNICHDNNKNTH